MRKQTLQSASERRPVNNGPLVVLGLHKKIDAVSDLYTSKITATNTYSTYETGPPDGYGPPCETEPIKGFDPPGGAGRPSDTGTHCGAGLSEGTGPPQIAGLLNGISRPLKTKMAELVQSTIKPQEKLKNQFHKRKEKMKNYKPIARIGQILASGLLMLHASAVFAAAGTSIANMATLTFNGGTVLESSPTGNSTTGAAAGTNTTFVEDRLINFSVAEATTATVQAATGTGGNVLTFTVTNLGNGTQDFLLAAVNAATGVGSPDPFGGNDDSFNSTTAVFVEDGTNAGYQVLEDTGLYIADLAPGIPSARTVYIVSTMPGALTDGDVSVVSLVAQAAVSAVAGTDDEAVAADAGAGINDDDNGNASPAGTNYCNATAACDVAAGTGGSDIADDPTTEEIVFNDPAGVAGVDADSAGATDVARNGQASDSGSYTIASAVLTVTKVALPVVFDSINGNSNPKAIPGSTAYIPYTITISNAGPTSAFLTDIQDVLGATLAIDPDFTSDGGTTFESATGDTFEVDTSGTLRTAAGAFFCTGDVGDVDTDGCDVTSLAAAATLTVGLNVAATNMAADAVPAIPYLAGELKAGESITIRFQVILQ